MASTGLNSKKITKHYNSLCTTCDVIDHVTIGLTMYE